MSRRNGTMLLNLTQHGRGDLDPQVIQISKDVGALVKNQRRSGLRLPPFEVFGDELRLLHAQPRQCLCHAPGLDGGPITLKALRAGGATLGKVSKVELLGSDVAADVCPRRTGADRDATESMQNRCRESPTSNLASRAGSCASPMTRAGSMTTTRASSRRMGRAVATWEPAISTTTSTSATRPAMSGVVRLPATASPSSPRKKQAPERLRFTLTAKPGPRSICPPPAPARRNRRFAKSPIWPRANMSLKSSIAATDRWPWMHSSYDKRRSNLTRQDEATGLRPERPESQARIPSS